MATIAVIVIAQEEEANIRHCLRSVEGWAKQTFVVDGGSRDRTVAVARDNGALVVENAFVDWARQRNWALDHLPIESEWVLFLDADETAPACLWEEIGRMVDGLPSSVAALSIRQQHMFLGRYLRHAHSSPRLIRVVRPDGARWECVGAREYAMVDGKVAHLSHLVRHEDHRGLTAWIEKQNRNATREALAMRTGAKLMTARTGPTVRNIRYGLHSRVWNRMPLFVRPILYFLYTYVGRLGFLDGWQGFVFCFLHSLWYRLLIDAKYREMLLQTGK